MKVAASPYASDYSSPSFRPGWFARQFPGTAFYAGILGIIWRASRSARRGAYDDHAFLHSSCETMQLLELIGTSISIENVAAYSQLTEPAVVVGNHMSTLETFALSSILLPFRPLTFVIKRQLLETPLFKHVMATRNPVVVGRSSPRDDLRIMLEEGEARLRAGISIAVFPQKSRAPSFTPAEFNSIAVKLAKRAGAPVVPLALRTDVWGIGSWMKDIGPIQPTLPVRFRFGEPITVTGNGRAAQEAVVNFIVEHLSGWNVTIHAEGR